MLPTLALPEIVGSAIEVGRADTHPEDTGPPPAPAPGCAVVEATDSGYVQLVNRERLLEIARHHDFVIHQLHGIGEFAVRGNPLLAIAPPERLTPELARDCAECFDLTDTSPCAVCR